MPLVKDKDAIVKRSLDTVKIQQHGLSSVYYHPNSRGGPLVTLRSALWAEHLHAVVAIFTQYQIPTPSSLHKKFYCSYGLDEKAQNAEVVTHSQSSRAHDYTVRGSDTMLYCPDAGWSPGKLIYISTEPEFNRSSMSFYLSVEVPEEAVSGKPSKLLICLKDQYTPRLLGPKLKKYDSIGIEAFIGWMELSRVLKVDHVALYNHSLTNALDAAIRMYQQEGFLSIHQVPGNSQLPNEKPSRYTGVWDCAIRYSKQYEYMMNVDTDEMIMPSNHNDLDSFLDQLEDRKIYTFRNTIFFTPDKDISEINPELLLNVLYGHVANYDPKYIVKLPSMCKYLNPHRCKLFEGGSQQMDIPPNIAKSHHFKNRDRARQKNLSTPRGNSANFIAANQHVAELWVSSFQTSVAKLSHKEDE